MKIDKKTLIIGVLIIVIIAGVAFSSGSATRQREDIKTLEKQLKDKKAAAVVAAEEIKDLKSIIILKEDKLIETVKKNSVLKKAVARMPKIRLIVDQKLINENKHLKEDLEKLRGSGVEVVDFPSLASCQINFNLCMFEKNQLEMRVLNYIEENKIFRVKNEALEINKDEQIKIIEAKETKYKKLIKKNVLQKIGIFAAAILIVILGK